MMEQPEALIKCLNFGARLSGVKGCTKLGGLDNNEKMLVTIQNLIIIACGSSFFAGTYGAKIFKALGCFDTVQVIEASEFNDLDIPATNPGILLITQSGETADVYKALAICKKMGVPSIGVVNAVGSMVATEVDCGLYLNSGREVSVPATKSFTGQITALCLIAVWISHHKQIKARYGLRLEMINWLHALPTTVGKTLYDIDEKCIKLGHLLVKEDHLIIIGKGFGAPIAKEGALKIKEVTYIHADAYVAGELKHGSIALIESTKENFTKVILLIFNDEYLNDMLLALSEMKANRAHTIVITDCYSKLPLEKVDEYVEVPELGLLTSMVSVLVFQKLAFVIGTLREINVDKPRNLAKTVTVG